MRRASFPAADAGADAASATAAPAAAQPSRITRQGAAKFEPRSWVIFLLLVPVLYTSVCDIEQRQGADALGQRPIEDDAAVRGELQRAAGVVLAEHHLRHGPVREAHGRAD